MLFYETLFPDRAGVIMFAKNIYDCAPEEYNSQFFCINATNGQGRKDENIVILRNILVEFDTIPLNEQLDIFKIMPVSTVVFSGGKSYHGIISLDVPCKDLLEYKAIVKRVQARLPLMDKSTSNPARLSRAPNNRRDNGVIQTCVHIGSRIDRTMLDSWLGPAPEEPKVIRTAREGKRKYRILAPTTNYYLSFGESDNRNKQLFLIACDMFRAGYDEDEIIDKVTPISSLSTKEINATIRSASKTVNRE